MKYQLRIYAVKPGEMDEWLAEWAGRIRPLRAKFGFNVIGAWTIEGESRFVWILGYAGSLAWEEADCRYYASPERASLEPDPARHLAGTEHWLMRSAGPGT
jgi:hypothetical protein